ncbi:hypothetical protein FISHEDRAFT_56434 [Fistulina hepatica ATCC 64428]|uniref:Uncharacterized protein n=1 Tax=Fistulina hepatica ATCC 64428 TaxID=1128425 RepID=A0A0D7ALV4_9AGAR|nr:hypothetical protein FISHEDRAFT_56434 [Fistulina hepatica ATCC 64428]
MPMSSPRRSRDDQHPPPAQAATSPPIHSVKRSISAILPRFPSSALRSPKRSASGLPPLTSNPTTHTSKPMTVNRKPMTPSKPSSASIGVPRPLADPHHQRLREDALRRVGLLPAVDPMCLSEQEAVDDRMYDIKRRVSGDRGRVAKVQTKQSEADKIKAEWETRNHLESQERAGSLDHLPVLPAVSFPQASSLFASISDASTCTAPVSSSSEGVHSSSSGERTHSPHRWSGENQSYARFNTAHAGNGENLAKSALVAPVVVVDGSDVPIILREGGVVTAPPPLVIPPIEVSDTEEVRPSQDRSLVAASFASAPQSAAADIDEAQAVEAVTAHHSHRCPLTPVVEAVEVDHEPETGPKEIRWQQKPDAHMRVEPTLAAGSVPRGVEPTLVASASQEAQAASIESALMPAQESQGLEAWTTSEEEPTAPVQVFPQTAPPPVQVAEPMSTAPATSSTRSQSSSPANPAPPSPSSRDPPPPKMLEMETPSECLGTSPPSSSSSASSDPSSARERMDTTTAPPTSAPEPSPPLNVNPNPPPDQLNSSPAQPTRMSERAPPKTDDNAKMKHRGPIPLSQSVVVVHLRSVFGRRRAHGSSATHARIPSLGRGAVNGHVRGPSVVRTEGAMNGQVSSHTRKPSASHAKMTSSHARKPSVVRRMERAPSSMSHKRQRSVRKVDTSSRSGSNAGTQSTLSPPPTRSSIRKASRQSLANLRSAFGGTLKRTRKGSELPDDVERPSDAGGVGDTVFLDAIVERPSDADERLSDDVVEAQQKDGSGEEKEVGKNEVEKRLASVENAQGDDDGARESERRERVEEAKEGEEDKAEDDSNTSGKISPTSQAQSNTSASQARVSPNILPTPSTTSLLPEIFNGFASGAPVVSSLDRTFETRISSPTPTRTRPPSPLPTRTQLLSPPLTQTPTTQPADSSSWKRRRLLTVRSLGRLTSSLSRKRRNGVQENGEDVPPLLPMPLTASLVEGKARGEVGMPHREEGKKPRLSLPESRGEDSRPRFSFSSRVDSGVPRRMSVSRSDEGGAPRTSFLGTALAVSRSSSTPARTSSLPQRSSSTTPPQLTPQPRSRSPSFDSGVEFGMNSASSSTQPNALSTPTPTNASLSLPSSSSSSSPPRSPYYTSFTMHNRATISAHTHAIADAESRRVTEVAFLM